MRKNAILIVVLIAIISSIILIGCEENTSSKLITSSNIERSKYEIKQSDIDYAYEFHTDVMHLILTDDEIINFVINNKGTPFEITEQQYSWLQNRIKSHINEYCQIDENILNIDFLEYAVNKTNDMYVMTNEDNLVKRTKRLYSSQNIIDVINYYKRIMDSQKINNFSTEELKSKINELRFMRVETEQEAFIVASLIGTANSSIDLKEIYNNFAYPCLWIDDDQVQFFDSLGAILGGGLGCAVAGLPGGIAGVGAGGVVLSAFNVLGQAIAVAIFE